MSRITPIYLPGVPHARQPACIWAAPWSCSDDPPPDELDALLDQALKLPLPSRTAFLDRVTADRPELRRTLESLLEGIDNDAPPGFLTPFPLSRVILNRIRGTFGDPPSEEEA